MLLDQKSISKPENIKTETINRDILLNLIDNSNIDRSFTIDIEIIVENLSLKLNKKEIFEE